MNAIEFQKQIQQLANDIESRINRFLDETGHTNEPAIRINFYRDNEIIGMEKRGVLVSIDATISAIAGE